MSDGGIDPRPPTVGFLMAALGVTAAGVFGGASVAEMLPVALVFGALFAFGMVLAQRFGSER